MREIKDKNTNSHKWNVVKKIENFRNLKSIDFHFVRGGITIIVGENNIGKTNLLDYIYEENKIWDGFEIKKDDYEIDFFPEVKKKTS